ncbi:MAG: hypothetical protein RLZZ28_999 [Bacteroidota bacterium]|jgi:uncharacterized membrane protein
MSEPIEFFGRLHPLLVHLPIGFLLLALVLQWLTLKQRYQNIFPAVRVAFLLGMISALLSCCSGWILSSGGEYDESILTYHKWMGITVFVAAAIGYLLSAKEFTGLSKMFSLLLLMLVLITGHLGGILTHGDAYLTKGLFGNREDSIRSARKVIPDIQEAMVFADIIQPILTDKCGTCHSDKKQKGGLRLDAKEWIVKGGKNGEVFFSGDPEKSPLYKRILLDPLEEKHMPPKGKPQVTEQEMMLIHWWISSKSGFDKKVKEVTRDNRLLPALLALSTATPVKKKPAMPANPIEKASPAMLDSLRNAGIIVLPVSLNTNYLSASFVSISKPSHSTIDLLKLVSRQLVWLKLSYADLSDGNWKTIGACSNLTRLSIEHTNLTDALINELSGLQNLEYLNLVGTKISLQGLQKLKSLDKLENIYLAETALKTGEFAGIQKLFPKAVIDTGNYRVKSLATDTQLLKAPPIKK